MAEVVTSGRVALVWKIRLKCHVCECVADFTDNDVTSYDDDDSVECPECETKLWGAKWCCRLCDDEGHYEDRGTSGIVCHCTNMGGMPASQRTDQGLVVPVLKGRAVGPVTLAVPVHERANLNHGVPRTRKPFKPTGCSVPMCGESGVCEDCQKRGAR